MFEMLSNPGQYFPPEYLHSLPPSAMVENQKSPLELLAQTCSSIGKDTTPAKIALPAMEKLSEKLVKSPGDQKPKSEEKKESHKESGKPGFRAIPYTEIPPLVPISNHDDSSSNSSSERKSSPEVTAERKEKSPTVAEKRLSPVKALSPAKDTQHDNSNRKSSSISPQHHPKPASIPSPIAAHQAATSASISSAHSAYLNGLRPGFHPLSPGAPHLPYSAGLSLMGHGLSPEAAAMYQSQLLAHSGLHSQGFSAASVAVAAAAQQSALKAGAVAASMNPYVSYTRVRTPSGATALVPVCKDPYCVNCQLTVQTSHTSTTCKSPGCSQCAHEKALLGLSAGAAGFGLPGNPLSMYPISLPTSATGLSPLSLHSMYPGALGAPQGLPYVCNWVSGHDYCGKRFNSSEELMAHLRSHTSSLDCGMPAGYGLGLSLSSASASLAHLGGGAPISPNSLRRAYPTSLSPGLLSSSRFHPYKSHLSGVTAPPPTAHLPPLGAYYPPYASLYGPRLGAAVP